MKTIKRKSTWPKWARWAAINGDGERWIFSKKPVPDPYVSALIWWNRGRYCCCIEEINSPKDYTKTLRKIV